MRAGVVRWCAGVLGSRVVRGVAVLGIWVLGFGACWNSVAAGAPSPLLWDRAVSTRRGDWHRGIVGQLSDGRRLRWRQLLCCGWHLYGGRGKLVRRVVSDLQADVQINGSWQPGAQLPFPADASAVTPTSAGGQLNAVACPGCRGMSGGWRL